MTGVHTPSAGWRRATRLGPLALFAAALAVGLAGCGKKPETLNAPEREEPVRYPRTYPST